MKLDHIPELKQIRIALGWSQLKLAHELQISQSVICYVEKGLIGVSDSLQKRVDALKQKHQLSEKQNEN